MYLVSWMVTFQKLREGTKRWNGCDRWTKARRRHCRKNRRRKSSASPSAMASFYATYSTKSTPVRFSRSNTKMQRSRIAIFKHIRLISDFLVILIVELLGGGKSCHIGDSVCGRSGSIGNTIFWEHEELS